ncbi:MAG TPA: ATP-binding protein [Anaerovoracaceae bacterium]|nr:ATP-binding protein [Anaerovoracaceae bacterium]
MSLQSRLTIIYSLLIGTVLLIFGVMIYALVNLILIDQIDQRLTLSAEGIIAQISATPNNSINTRSLAEYSSGENQYFQVWKNSNQLIFSRPIGIAGSLDDFGLHQRTPVYTNSNVNGIRLRVLSVPLVTNRAPVGVLQVGIDLTLVDITLRTLSLVLIFLVVIAVILAAISTWIIARQTLSPLVTMTEFASQITESNDLTRRIPLPSRNEKDEVTQLIVAFNETLERLDKLLSSQKRLMADVSHELRTPLTVIKGEVGLVRKYRQFDDDTINSIDTEVDRLTRLVGNLLLLAQAETGDLPMNFKNFQLDELVCEVYQHMQTLADDKLEVCLQNVDQIMINGDRDRIKQVLLNLIGNAIQYTPPGGKVSIIMENNMDYVEVSVTDSGPGIPKEDLDHIFDRFYRGERSRSRSRHSGFGLGLSIAKYIIDQHAGDIQVESTVNHGTVFKMHLPKYPRKDDMNKSNG